MEATLLMAAIKIPATLYHKRQELRQVAASPAFF